MRALCVFAGLIMTAGCGKPPNVDTITATPIPSTSAVLRSPNGQKQVLLVRFGTRWRGNLDDTFAATSAAVFAAAADGLPPQWLGLADPSEPQIGTEGWKPLREVPTIVADAWVAGDPALRGTEPSSLVVLIRIAGTSDPARAITASLAGELAAAAGLSPPGEEAADDPGLIASRVAVEAAARAVTREETGEMNPNGKVAIIQVPVFLNDRYLAVEHAMFEDHGGEGGGFASSRFSLHDVATGASLDPDSLLDGTLREKLATIAGVRTLGGEIAVPSEWHPARPGIVLFYGEGRIAPVERGAVRVVVKWRDVLPLLAGDSPLRAIAASIH